MSHIISCQFLVNVTGERKLQQKKKKKFIIGGVGVKIVILSVMYFFNDPF